DYDKAIALRPDYAEAYYNRANVLHEQKRLEAAIADYGRAISFKPDHAAAYNNRGFALHELKQPDAAIADYNRAIAIKPDYAAAYNNRGLALQELKLLAAAMADFTKAIALQPDLAEPYNARAAALRELKQLDAALADYDKAIALRPDYVEAYNNRGIVRQELKQLDAAIADYGAAIALKPDYVEAYNNRGTARRELKQLDSAVADYDKAIALQPAYPEAYNNRANARQDLQQFEAAIADYGAALAVKPDYAEAYYNRGNARRELRQLDAALADYGTAIALKPDYASAYWNKALISLLRGDFATGFELYEWRWKNPNLNMVPHPFAQPLWLGQAPLRDKRLLLHSEQGLGDTIQFCRYAALAAEAGAQVILAVPPSLVALLKSLPGVSQVLADGDPLPDFDCHCPLMSLPLAFKTGIDTIPSPAPYLHADDAKARVWRERIGAPHKLKVGIVWSGGVRPDQPPGWSERRNVRLDLFARALSVIDAEFFSLQKGDPAESEIRGREAEFWPRGNLHNLAAGIEDFADTAALVANLDLVISVDTSSAHLAAALGTPTWILNRLDGDWRWLLDRDDSPWYRSARLYRQDESQSWEPVLQHVADDLAQLASLDRAAASRRLRSG
ncbi:MAG TPA: tetratricopeptide repeat protein, partial [Stellaceae bacterium]|nr:tetratricopeptide repeat protein [Stellaceae bacterium]